MSPFSRAAELQGQTSRERDIRNRLAIGGVALWVIGVAMAAATFKYGAFEGFATLGGGFVVEGVAVEKAAWNYHAQTANGAQLELEPSTP
ncbi:MAG TPA: hypothetical protein VLG37_01040 [Candidatus Saccharimonadales bacterium]|nr:hypothetical protein [Candidatus Saccharimonadales bacterium]